MTAGPREGYREMDAQERARQLALKARSRCRRGDLRGAFVALREACLLDESNAARWAQFGDVARRTGRTEDAERAMKQALWLRQQSGDLPRTRVVRRLLEEVRAGIPRRTRSACVAPRRRAGAPA